MNTLTCPVCGRRDSTLFVCSQCWPKVPAKDRHQLGEMHRRGQETTSKVAKIVRNLKAPKP